MSSESHPAPGRGFDAPIPPGGYRGWHIDAQSDDGRYGITLAAILGSPVLARGTRADPPGYGAMLACLRGCGATRWSMTRRGGAEIMRWPQALVIGLNTVFRSATTFSFGIDDLTAPWPARLRGTVEVHVAALPDRSMPLDPAGRHRWQPLAAGARVRLAMQRPAAAWEGNGWIDAQEGDVPLDETFLSWSRARVSLSRDTFLAHEFRLRGGGTSRVACRLDTAGGITLCETAQAALPPTRWRLPRRVPADANAARVIATLADTPLYARTLVEAPLFGQQARILHETLCLQRLRRNWGRLLLFLRSPPASI